MKRLGVVISVLAMLVGAAPALMAQEDSGPQILTSDLALENEVTSDSLTVNFVILSDAPVTEVTINGEKQQITAGDTVSISKQLSFTKARNLITISATDKNGKTRERVYAVTLKGAAAPAEHEAKLAYFASVKASYEIDGNPTNDLSTPIAIQGVDIKGVVKDSEQPDTRITLQATGGLTYGKWTAFVGGLSQTYGKSDNDGLNTQIVYFGGSGRWNLGGTRDFVLTYVFTDLNVGGNDYAQMHTISPAFELKSETEKADKTHTFALDLTSKNFASDTQTDGGQYALRWGYKRVNKDKLNQFESLIAYGTNTEGDKLDDYSYLGANFDWINRWEKGFRFDAGFGFEYRNFP
ncbi:MAG TPA: hypothetical protein VF678_15705, partial [bacterium]